MFLYSVTTKTGRGVLVLARSTDEVKELMVHNRRTKKPENVVQIKDITNDYRKHNPTFQPHTLEPGIFSKAMNGNVDTFFTSNR